ncbi:MAG: VapC toxin family PIN domain ribonuclease [Bacteroidetes bacterium 4572_114]|nr:MAG: VapC toxin family PIN domain ribonuclease [Bacteroidetes bacterium 4572_114]
MEYILDTNICIYIIKRKPAIVLEKFKKFPLGSIGISAITLAELQFGIQKSSNPEKNLNALNQFIIPLEIIDFDYNATIEYGIIRAELEKKGTPIGSLDTLIGAHAKSLDLTLVTNNEKEFVRILGLRIENWTKD